MKIAGAAAAIALALVLQTTIGQMLVRGTAALDLVLVVVVYVALTSARRPDWWPGRSPGWCRTRCRAASSASAGWRRRWWVILGLIGTQFIVAKPLPRFVVFAAATVLHAVVFMGLYMLLGVRHFGVPVGGVPVRPPRTRVVGVVGFQVIETFPGFLERRAANRGSRMRRRLD